MIHGTVQVGGNEETTLLMRGVKTLSGGSGSDQWDESIQYYVINYIVQEVGQKRNHVCSRTISVIAAICMS